jgi:O6-methylguanine-DNA--protein-cysteine methyltransferase
MRLMAKDEQLQQIKEVDGHITRHSSDIIKAIKALNKKGKKSDRLSFDAEKLLTEIFTTVQEQYGVPSDVMRKNIMQEIENIEYLAQQREDSADDKTTKAKAQAQRNLSTSEQKAENEAKERFQVFLETKEDSLKKKSSQQVMEAYFQHFLQDIAKSLKVESNQKDETQETAKNIPYGARFSYEKLAPKLEDIWPKLDELRQSFHNGWDAYFDEARKEITDYQKDDKSKIFFRYFMTNYQKQVDEILAPLLTDLKKDIPENLNFMRDVLEQDIRAEILAITHARGPHVEAKEAYDFLQNKLASLPEFHDKKNSLYLGVGKEVLEKFTLPSINEVVDSLCMKLEHQGAQSKRVAALKNNLLHNRFFTVDEANLTMQMHPYHVSRLTNQFVDQFSQRKDEKALIALVDQVTVDIFYAAHMPKRKKVVKAIEPRLDTKLDDLYDKDLDKRHKRFRRQERHYAFDGMPPMGEEGGNTDLAVNIGLGLMLGSSIIGAATGADEQKKKQAEQGAATKTDKKEGGKETIAEKIIREKNSETSPEAKKQKRKERRKLVFRRVLAVSAAVGLAAIVDGLWNDGKVTKKFVDFIKNPFGGGRNDGKGGRGGL